VDGRLTALTPYPLSLASYASPTSFRTTRVLLTPVIRTPRRGGSCILPHRMTAAFALGNPSRSPRWWSGRAGRYEIVPWDFATCGLSIAVRGR
jgi:hypothetical protein